MKWFGKAWAPVCQKETEVSTPAGSFCFHGCDRPIVNGDQGFLVPHSGPRNQTGLPDLIFIEGDAYVVYHTTCFLEEIGVSREPTR